MTNGIIADLLFLAGVAMIGGGLAVIDWRYALIACGGILTLVSVLSMTGRVG